MGRKALFQRQKKIALLCEKHAERRAKLVKVIRNKGVSYNERLAAYRELKKYCTVNSSPTRLRNICPISYRCRGTIRDFHLSRSMFRKYALEGLLPGVQKD